MIEGYLTTKQGAERSGLSRDHVRRLLEWGRLEGMKVGRDWLVSVNSLDHYMANRPKRGGRGRKNGDVQ